MPDRKWDKELFPAILKQAIHDRGMSQRGLARVVDISPNSVHSYLAGRNLPALDVFAKIAIALNYSADYLLGFTTEPKTLNGEEDSLKEDILIIRSSYATMDDEQKKAFLDFIRSISKS